MPSVLSFYVKYTDNCEVDSLFSGDEAQLQALLEPSWLGLPCRYVIICMQLCMHVAVCNQNSGHTRKDLLIELLSEGP